jgi:hypothetical protein
MNVHNLLSLLHLLARYNKGKNPLIDYFQPHIITNSKYLNILRKKKMEKATTEEIKASKKKGKRIQLNQMKLGSIVKQVA